MDPTKRVCKDREVANQLAHQEFLKSKEQELDNFKCCICMKWLVDPTFLECGHVIDRHCLLSLDKRSFRSNGCPLCRGAISDSAPSINKKVKPFFWSSLMDIIVPKKQCPGCNAFISEIDYDDPKYKCECLPKKCAECHKNYIIRLNPDHETKCKNKILELITLEAQGVEMCRVAEEELKNMENTLKDLKKQIKAKKTENSSLKFNNIQKVTWVLDGVPTSTLARYKNNFSRASTYLEDRIKEDNDLIEEEEEAAAEELQSMASNSSNRISLD